MSWLVILGKLNLWNFVSLRKVFLFSTPKRLQQFHFNAYYGFDMFIFSPFFAATWNFTYIINESLKGIRLLIEAELSQNKRVLGGQFEGTVSCYLF